MNPLDLLDAEIRGPMRVRVAGGIVELPAADSLSWRMILASLTDPLYFLGIVLPPDFPHIEWWKLEPLRRAWMQHNGLPDSQQAQRLVYMVERYWTGIEYDLRYRLDTSLGDLWRERRWRELLNLIDQLPAASQLNRLMADDEEHMEAVLRAQAKQSSSGGSSGPSMAEWSQTNALLAKVLDAIRQNTAVTRAAAGDKKQPNLQPEPRPRTALDRVRDRLERERHQSLANILLRDRPDRAGSMAGSPESPVE